MTDATPGAGNIAVTLDGKEMELVPSAAACLAISNIAGGLNAAAERCRVFDMATICEVLKAGLGLNPVLAKKLPEAVYNTGVFELAGPCIDFINVVGNGGRPLPEDDGEAGADAAQDPPQPA